MVPIRLCAPAEVDGAERDGESRAQEHGALGGELHGLFLPLPLVEREVLRIARA